MQMDLTRRGSADLGSTREQRQLSQEIHEAHRPAKRAAGRLQAEAFVAAVGLINTEVLTNIEVGAAQRQGSLMDGRARLIVDTYAQRVALTLINLPME
jgi:hypothetical protein